MARNWQTSTPEKFLQIQNASREIAGRFYLRFTFYTRQRAPLGNNVVFAAENTRKYKAEANFPKI
jgi:hypothetical protein